MLRKALFPSLCLVFVLSFSACGGGGGTSSGDECVTAVDCNDDNPCTEDKCSSGVCSFDVGALNDQECDDGDPCSASDTCSNGTCKGITLDMGTICETGDCCTVGVCMPCDPNTQECLTDLVCEESPACDDDNDCTSDSCACDGESADCTHEAVADSAQQACEYDPALCTADTCVGGVCTKGPDEKDDNNPCTEDICDNKTGVVTHQPIISEDPIACDDGNPCTASDEDKCVLGSCVGGGPTDCDDGDPCTVDSCDDSTEDGCVHVAGNDGALCFRADDPCWLHACDSGVCGDTVVEPADCNDNNPCTTDSCDENIGCVYEELTPGTVCALADQPCAKGVCSFSGDDFICQLTGLASDNDPCEDGNPCTIADKCLAGNCVSSDNICLERPVANESQAIGSVSVADLGFRRYAIQWTASLSGDVRGRIRTTNGSGTRLNETSDLTASDPKPDSPVSGRIAVQGTNGFMPVTSGVCDGCNASVTVSGFSSGGTEMAVQKLWTDGQVETYQGVLDSRVVGITTNQGFGLVEGYTGVATGAQPAPGEVRYRAISFSSGSVASPTPLLNSGEVASGTLFDARSLPGSSNRYILAWVSADQQKIYAAHGTEEYLADIGGVYTEGNENILNIKVAALPPTVGGGGSAETFVDDNAARFVVAWQTATHVYIGRWEAGETSLKNVTEVVEFEHPQGKLSDVDMFSDGAYVVVWEDESDAGFGLAVKAKLFGKLGTPGANFQVNLKDDGDQYKASVSVVRELGGNESWVVAFADDQHRVWTRTFKRDGSPDPGAYERPLNVNAASSGVPRGVRGPDNTLMIVWAVDERVQAIILDDEGVPTMTSFQVANDVVVTTVAGGSDAQHVDVAAGVASYYVSWVERGGGPNPDVVKVQRWTSSGTPIGSPITVGSSDGYDQHHPSIAVSEAGKVLVVWRSYNDVWGQMLNSGLQLQGGAFKITDRGSKLDYQPDVSSYSDGTGFIVVWSGTYPEHSSHKGVFGVKVTLGGTLQGSAQQINQEPLDSFRPVVSASQTGTGSSALVCWEHNADTPSIYCRRVDLQFGVNAIGEDVLIKQLAYSEQKRQGLPHAIHLSDDAMVTAWVAQGVDDLTSLGIQVQEMQPATNEAKLSRSGPRQLGNRSSWTSDQVHPFMIPLNAFQYLVGWISGHSSDIHVRVLSVIQ